MQSIELQSVTNARASYDYHPDNTSWYQGAPQFPGNQWKPLGTTGIFGWSIAIAPTKDNFWSTDEQPGTSYSDYVTIREHYNRLQSAVSTLSKGPVAPSDKIGASALHAGLLENTGVVHTVRGRGFVFFLYADIRSLNIDGFGCISKVRRTPR